MKKWLYIVGIVFIVCGFLFFYVLFNGNFVTKVVAKGKVGNFVEEAFEGHTQQLVQSRYNFKEGRYVFNYEIYMNGMPATYSFSIGGPVRLKDRIYSYLHFETVYFQTTGPIT